MKSHLAFQGQHYTGWCILNEFVQNIIRTYILQLANCHPPPIVWALIITISPSIETCYLHMQQQPTCNWTLKFLDNKIKGQNNQTLKNDIYVYNFITHVLTSSSPNHNSKKTLQMHPSQSKTTKCFKDYSYAFYDNSF